MTPVGNRATARSGPDPIVRGKLSPSSSLILLLVRPLRGGPFVDRS